jgi:hypothetical protein
LTGTWNYFHALTQEMRLMQPLGVMQFEAAPDKKISVKEVSVQLLTVIEKVLAGVILWPLAQVKISRDELMHT